MCARVCMCVYVYTHIHTYTHPDVNTMDQQKPNIHLSKKTWTYVLEDVQNDMEPV